MFSHSDSSGSEASEDEDLDESEVSGAIDDPLGEAVALRIEVPYFSGALTYQVGVDDSLVEHALSPRGRPVYCYRWQLILGVRRIL